MKKSLIVILTLVFILILSVSCGSDGKTTESQNDTTVLPLASDSIIADNTFAPESESIVSESHDVAVTETPETRESVLVEFDGYSALSNPVVFVPQSGSDKKYDYSGSGAGLIEAVNSKYSSYEQTYYIASSSGAYSKAGVNRLKTIEAVLASYNVDKSKKTIRINVEEPSVNVVPDYISYTAPAGTFISVTFKTSVNAIFKVSIGTKGSADGSINHDNILPTGKAGNYTGNGQMTVPYLSEGDYFINISCGGKVIETIPIKITPTENKSEFHLLMTGAWDLIGNDDYRLNLVDLFYSVYPRLYARWAINKNEPKTITFIADRAYDGVAYCQGTKVVVSTTYAKGHPNDLGFFAHEITHSTQQYSGFSSKWWTENMANHGRFRYYHWLTPQNVTFYSASSATIKDWNYAQYGDCYWFFAYMDDKYPTTKEGGLGLIDSINEGIKKGRIKSDDPYTAGSAFNNVVKEFTGFDTIDLLRQQFAKELTEGTWTFVGFADYKDNFLIEDLPLLENLKYPKITELTHGDITNEVLANVVKTGDNLAKGASIINCSGYLKSNEAPEKLVDSNETTKWCVTKSSTTDYTANLAGMDHYIVLDLGEVKTFNTYTMVNAGVKENKSYNTKCWEILVSSDGENWKSVDYRENNTLNELSVNIGEQSARYVRINIIKSDSGTGTARIYEFMLFNTK